MLQVFKTVSFINNQFLLNFNMSGCSGCGGCCRHVALEIDVPDKKEDYEDIYWYLLHENISVFVTEDDDEDSEEDEKWYIEFLSKCKVLRDDNLCGIYEKRPRICANYDPEECTNSDGESEELARFNNEDDFLEYLRKNKGISLR